MRKNIVIRHIEEKDKGNYLKLFNDEDFGCIGIHSNLKPSIYEEEKVVSRVLDKSIISTAILVIEDNNEFIGYTTISRPSEHKYHIGQFVIRKEKQQKGYGKMLMDEVKRYAALDSCSIELECISSATNFFIRQGFTNTFSSKYFHPTPKKVFMKKEQLFVDYALIEQELEEKNKQEIKSFRKFLNSPVFKEIMKL